MFGFDFGCIPDVINVAMGEEKGLDPDTLLFEPSGDAFGGVDEDSLREQECVGLKIAAGVEVHLLTLAISVMRQKQKGVRWILRGGSLASAELVRFDDRKDEVSEGSFLLEIFGGDGAQHFSLGMVGDASGAVDEEFGCDAGYEVLEMGEHMAFEVGDIVERCSVGQSAGCIDWGAWFGLGFAFCVGGMDRVVVAPVSDGIEVFEDESGRVEFAVASCATLFAGVSLHEIADGFCSSGVWSDGRDGGWRRRGRVVQNIFEDPFASEDGLGIDTVGGCHHGAWHCEEPTTATASG